MENEDVLLPFEFHLMGTPISLQAKSTSKERWKSAVAEAARLRVEETVEWAYLEPEPLALTIYYFPTAAMGGDVDNIVKPIMDALIGVVYTDDKAVERVTVQKFEPSVDWEFATPSEQLTIALDTTSGTDGPTPVVYVHVANDLSWRRL
ncbi:MULTISPECIES: RusA family crossover junction endodeoxyribonuclease [Rhizobium]|uniref:Uncharacterized protein n=1 Tax=Rhizobium favelukesii TaxID=348824 RepID=W6RGF6_9HYPH|nr:MULTISPECIES: RusA family crossover junction endodeoxyribonuclease [Rhizobium]MCS0463317.1 RusA family crossover junction endodeoxyribonuclease [Rhizobium favelukesii]UFS84647.1 RusA family crossover junction endodeoxyribonuclease [Rhizobium sp. T136]CDM60297.1 hypothetical protein LPU83_pLPU83b_0309 [Rhizobium favelukesii]